MRRVLKCHICQHWLHLYPWQVTAAAWILLMWNSLLCGALLADNPDVGKTISALYAFSKYLDFREGGLPHLSQRLGTPLLPSEPLIHRSSLIICSSSATGVWKTEIRTYFQQLSLHLFYDLKFRVAPENQAATLPSRVADLQKWLKVFDQRDPATSRVIVLIIYSTWYRRTVSSATRDPSGSDDDANNEAEEVFEESDISDADEPPPKHVFKTEVVGVFEVVILDEAHKLKSRRSKTFAFVSQLEQAKMLQLSGTSTLNKPLDLVGLLALFWKEDYMLLDDDGKTALRRLEEFHYREAYARCKEIGWATAGDWAYILHHKSFFPQVLATSDVATTRRQTQAKTLCKWRILRKSLAA
ncbi:MAG: hypothetical protein Q9195_006373 [Heterodermia aff. obscurata]